MSDACYCDYDPPAVQHIEIRKARKQHKCSECYSPIYPGEKYEHSWGIWDGSASTNKTCADCLDIREYVQAHVPCFCWYYGDMIENARDYMRDYAWQVPGMGMEVGRKFVKIKRKYDEYIKQKQLSKQQPADPGANRAPAG